MSSAAACVAATAIAYGQSSSRSLEDAIEAARAAIHAPAVSVGLAADGRTVYAKAFGHADLEQHVPATADTRFRTASLAKPLTATGVLQLVEKGAIDLDAPIQQYCAAFPRKRWPVTARELLGHLSGIRHYTKPGEGATTTHYFSITDSLARFADDPLLFEPGAKYAYSTYGFSVLGCAIEGASGTSYAEYMRTHVFEPAHMTHTTVDDVFQIVPDRARGYQILDEKGYRSLPPSVRGWAKVGGVYNAVLDDTSAKVPGGGLVSTPSDLLAFADALLSGALLKPATRDLMWTEQKTTDGKATGYGMGWGVAHWDGKLYVSHSGEQAGATSYFSIDVTDRTVLAVMSNLENADLAGIRTVLRGPLSPLARPAPASSAVPATGTASGAEGGVHASAAQGEPYTLKTAKGNESATLVHVSVPEIHANPAGPHVTLAVVKWSARERPTRPPVLYLAGGPGQSGIADARVEETFDLLERAREASDVLLLDQRGTGLSTPRLVCPSSGPLPSDFFLSAESMARALEPRVRACRDTWRGRGVHLDAYTTAESAEDIAEVARQLGGGRVSLLGFSYGTHLATAVVRQHPEVVDRVVFAGYEGPDDTVKLPWTFDAQVAHISALAARQPEVAAAMPDFRAALLRVLTRAAAQPFEVHAGAETLRIGRDGLLYLLRRDIGDTNDLPQFPRLIAQLEVGDTTLLAGYAARRFRQLGSGVSLMGLAMDCSSGASVPRAAEVREQEPSSIFGAMTNPLSDGACEILGLHAAPGAHYTPLVSPVPALFVSGTLDSNTPPYQAERARWGLFNASHLIVRDAGHESTLVPAVRDAIVRFLRGEAVEDAVVSGPALTFAR